MKKNLKTGFTSIREKELNDGFVSLYLDTIYFGRRYYNFLNLKVKSNPKTKEEREHYKKCWELARETATKRDWDLMKGDKESVEKYDTAFDFVKFFDNYMEERKGLADLRMFSAAKTKLVKFAKKPEIPCFEIDATFIEKFWGFLKVELNGATPHNYMKKVKRIVKAAYKKRHFKVDLMEDFNFVQGKSVEKSVLSPEEITKLSKASCPNINVKMAALFSCNTGLRFCDILNLRWKNINGDKLDIIQQKTKNRLILTLNDDAKFFLRKRGDIDDLVFSLPSHTAVNRSIKTWVENAGIEKKITYHCFRHTFGTNLISYGVDVATASKLLGHSNLKETLRYVRISEDLKRQATYKLPSIFSKNQKNDDEKLS